MFIGMHFLNLKKASDMADHSIQLNMLDMYGLEWMPFPVSKIC